MKKIILSSLCVALLFFGFITNANACSANCSFGSCVTECAAGLSAICGCEFGIAICKCDEAKGGKTDGSVMRNYNQRNIDLFEDYAKSVSLKMAEVAGCLHKFRDNDSNAAFEEKYKAYVSAINALTAEEKQLFTDWIDAHPGQ